MSKKYNSELFFIVSYYMNLLVWVISCSVYYIPDAPKMSHIWVEQISSHREHTSAKGKVPWPLITDDADQHTSGLLSQWLDFFLLQDFSLGSEWKSKLIQLISTILWKLILFVRHFLRKCPGPKCRISRVADWDVAVTKMVLVRSKFLIRLIPRFAEICFAVNRFKLRNFQYSEFLQRMLRTEVEANLV